MDSIGSLPRDRLPNEARTTTLGFDAYRSLAANVFSPEGFQLVGIRTFIRAHCSIHNLPSVLSPFGRFHRYKSTWSIYIPIYGRRVILSFSSGSKPFKSRVASTAERFEPSSRTLLIGEQPNPWGLLQSQDRASRHRGAEPWRRCERSAKTSLLSPE